MSTERPTSQAARSTSTTRRCATAPSRRASRSPSRTSCASPSSSTISASPTSRAAGRAPTRRTRSSSPERRDELQLETATLVAFGSTRRSGAKAAQRRDARGISSRRAPRPSASSPSPPTCTSPRRCAPARRGDRDGVRLGRLLARGRPARVLRRRALLRRLPARRRLRAPVLDAAEEAGAEALVLCDTNGGTLPDEVERDRRRRPARARRSRSACTSTTTAGARSPTRSRPCARARPRSRAASTATASGPATPTSSAIIANLTLKMGVETIPTDRLERLTLGGPPRRRDRQPHPRPAAALCRHGGLHPQGRPAHERPRPPLGRLRARLARRRRQRDPRRRERARRALDARR